jgi:hypothetical protein
LLLPKQIDLGLHQEATGLDGDEQASPDLSALFALGKSVLCRKGKWVEKGLKLRSK